MSTPNYFAGLPTAPRRQALRIIERARLADAVEHTSEEQAAARKDVHRLNHAIDASRAEREKLHSYSLMYPPSKDIDTQRAHLAKEHAQLTREHRHAAALRAAADIVHKSAVLERAWSKRPNPTNTDGRLFANMLFPPVSRFVSAPGYTVTVLHPYPNVQHCQFWRELHHTTVKRSRARSILDTWAELDQAYILRDPHGRFYVATPTQRLELVPTDIAPPQTEGDALRAALAVYDFPAYDDAEGGTTWLSVPLERYVSHEETHDGPHFRISSGKHAARIASQHGERWGASLHDENGEYVTTLDGSPGGSTLAEDCAHTARAIAEFIPPQD